MESETNKTWSCETWLERWNTGNQSKDNMKKDVHPTRDPWDGRASTHCRWKPGGHKVFSRVRLTRGWNSGTKCRKQKQVKVWNWKIRYISQGWISVSTMNSLCEKVCFPVPLVQYIVREQDRRHGEWRVDFSGTEGKRLHCRIYLHSNSCYIWAGKEEL